MTKSVKSFDVPLEAFSKVVEAIYDCALDPTRWQETIRLTAELCRSQVCIISVHDYTNGRSELAYNLGYTDKFIRLHEEKYAAMNPFLDLFRIQPIGVATTQAMLIDDHEFLESRFIKNGVSRSASRTRSCSKCCRLTSDGLVVGSPFRGFSRATQTPMFAS